MEGRRFGIDVLNGSTLELVQAGAIGAGRGSSGILFMDKISEVVQIGVFDF
jgi:hypothetical protein